MPLGASITWGQYSTYGNGYREDLLELLEGSGFNVTMTGSQQSGNMTQNENGGWPGARIDQVEGYAKESVPERLPNIIAINAGTNDCVQNFSVSTAGQRMQGLLDYLWEASPGTTLILSTLIICLDQSVEQSVVALNSQLVDLASKLDAQGKRIILADMHGLDGPQPHDMANDIHPNNAGYDKMAKIWFTAIQEAVSKGFVQSPLLLNASSGCGGASSVCSATSSSSLSSSSGTSASSAAAVTQPSDVSSTKESNSLGEIGSESLSRRLNYLGLPAMYTLGTMMLEMRRHREDGLTGIELLPAV